MSGTTAPTSANVATCAGRSAFASRNRSHVLPERGYETRKTSVGRTVRPRAAGGGGVGATAARARRSVDRIPRIAASLVAPRAVGSPAARPRGSGRPGAYAPPPGARPTRVPRDRRVVAPHARRRLRGGARRRRHRVAGPPDPPRARAPDGLGRELVPPHRHRRVPHDRERQERPGVLPAPARPHGERPATRDPDDRLGARGRERLLPRRSLRPPRPPSQVGGRGDGAPKRDLRGGLPDVVRVLA